MGADLIHDDRTAGASELARKAVDVLADAALDARSIREVRQEEARLARLRPSMAAIEGALRIFVGRLEEVCTSLDWERACSEAREGTLGDLESARRGVVESALGVLDHERPERIVTISCSSTVRAILEAREPAAVLVSEGRPGLEGREIARSFATVAGSVELCTDAALTALLGHGDLVLVGADGVEADGRLINKVGTFALAVAASRLGVGFFAACERFKFSARTGLALEAKEGGEVWPESPDGVTVLNPYFERTEPDLVTGFITDDGVLRWDGGWVRA